MLTMSSMVRATLRYRHSLADRLGCDLQVTGVHRPRGAREQLFRFFLRSLRQLAHGPLHDRCVLVADVAARHRQPEHAPVACKPRHGDVTARR
jgi:hypothetical protein